MVGARAGSIVVDAPSCAKTIASLWIHVWENGGATPCYQIYFHTTDYQSRTMGREGLTGFRSPKYRVTHDTTAPSRI